MATEVVLFEKLGKNEVVEAANFGTNQQKKLRRSEHPTRRASISALSMNSLREIGNKRNAPFSIDIISLREIGNKRDAVFLLILFPYGKSKRSGAIRRRAQGSRSQPPSFRAKRGISP
ncbi:MAG: hypothetical protein LBO71_04950, partial [Prevotellaceae bacterium]|nr:hypothetical protein [Prevotellaceae bacterium]